MATTIPTGFHRVKAGEVTTYEKGHFYFFSDIRKLYLAIGPTPEDLEVYSSSVDDVRYSPQAKKITVTFLNGGKDLTIDLSVFAEKTQLGDLSSLTTTAKSDLVSAINEVLAAVDAGGTGSVVTITESTPSGYAKSYTVKQGSSTVGVINIPKDMVVSSGTVETNPSGRPAGTYLVLTLANATSDKVYINVGKLVDLYTAKQAATQVQLSINSATREISATIVAGGVGTTELASKCVTGAKIADGAVNTAHISNGAVSMGKLDSVIQAMLTGIITASDITTGTANGTISVDGTDVPVKGLGTAAYQPSSAFATPNQVTAAEQNAKNYADSLHYWSSWEEE